MPASKPNASRKSSAPAKAVSPPLQGSATALQDAGASALPPAWKWTRLKFVADVRGGLTLGKSYGAADLIELPYLRVANVQDGYLSLDEVVTVSVPQREADANLLQPGDVLMNEGGDDDKLGRGCVWRGEISPCLHQNHVFAVRPHGVDSDWLNHWTGSAYAKTYFELKARRSTNLASISATSVGELPLPLPPLPTQRAIAGYLDRETKRLDELVRAKEGLLELVAEKRRALITRAVTRGLNPKSPLRDSGIPWLGLIPAHWEIERSKWLLTERDERSTTGEEEMLTVSHITGVTPRSEKDVNMFEAETNEGYKLCQAGDLVINTLWAWMGAMGTARVPGMVSPAYNVYTPGPRLTSDYVDALVRIPVFAQEAIRFSKGVWSSRLRLYPEGLYEIWFPVPPLAEQRAIVAHIATETAKLDALRSSAERTIRLLKERRSALISAAVTGKIAISEPTA
jgi:type I restriction enzyme, S subunit